MNTAINSLSVISTNDGRFTIAEEPLLGRATFIQCNNIEELCNQLGRILNVDICHFNSVGKWTEYIERMKQEFF
jgi:hypothetical protein